VVSPLRIRRAASIFEIGSGLGVETSPSSKRQAGAKKAAQHNAIHRKFGLMRGSCEVRAAVGERVGYP
jgi:hypothetical protein